MNCECDMWGNKCYLPLGEVNTAGEETIVLLGMMKRHLTFTPVQRLSSITDFE